MADKTKVKIVVLDAYLGDREYVFDVPAKPVEAPTEEHSPTVCVLGCQIDHTKPAPIEEEAKECCDIHRRLFCNHPRTETIQKGLSRCLDCNDTILDPKLYNPSTTPQDTERLDQAARHLSKIIDENVNKLITAWNVHIKEGNSEI